MLPTLSLAVALALPSAPLPRTPEVPVGTPPVILNLKPDADRKLRLTVRRTTTRTVKKMVVNPNGGAPQQVDREYRSTRTERVEFADVNGLDVYTTDGKELDLRDAMSRVSDGGIVLLSTDGKRVSPQYLKLFRDDLLVLVSPEFANLPTQSTTTVTTAVGNQVIIRGAAGGPIQVQVRGQAVPIPVNVVPPVPAP